MVDKMKTHTVKTGDIKQDWHLFDASEKPLGRLASDIAKEAVHVCRKMGYQVTAVVVDRNGNAQVMMRDVHASRFTMQIAEDKANSVILSGIESGTFRDNRSDIRAELNHVDGLLMMQGGLPIHAAGSLIGVDVPCALT